MKTMNRRRWLFSGLLTALFCGVLSLRRFLFDPLFDSLPQQRKTLEGFLAEAARFWAAKDFAACRLQEGVSHARRACALPELCALAHGAELLRGEGCHQRESRIRANPGNCGVPASPPLRRGRMRPGDGSHSQGSCREGCHGIAVDVTRAAALELPSNSKDELRRNLDCAVVRRLRTILETQKLPAIDTVKGVFTEGEPAYPVRDFDKRLIFRSPRGTLNVSKASFAVPQDQLHS